MAKAEERHPVTAPARAELTLREAVIATARAMNAQANNRGRAGNVSARLREGDFDGFLITPSGMAYESIGPADVVALHADGSPRDQGGPVASSEWRFHREIYRARAEIGGIVHSHSMFATTLACHGMSIPAFHYMVAAGGGKDIRCAPYALFGTQELADAALAALQDRKACLLAHHGMIAIGSAPEDALGRALEVETLAEMYWRVLQVGTPAVLSDAEMAAVVDRFAGYGQQRPAR